MNKYLVDTDSTADRNIISLSDFGIKNALIIGKYQYNSARQKLDDHFHKDMIEICYCHKGNQVYKVDDQNYHIKGGDVFVTFPNEVHSTGANPEEKGVLYWLLIHVPIRTAFFNYDKKDSEAFISALINLPRRHFKGLPEMRKTLENIIVLAEKRHAGLQKINLENLIISFLLQVIDAAAVSTQSIKPASGNTDKIHQFINDHYKESLSIETMAEMLHLSESRFKSWFKGEFGIPPLEFILRKRIDEAKNMMQSQTHMNMSDIAYDLGFSSPQHFATIFKRYTFLSPKEFKASLHTIGC